jgi:hypothetical protein
MSKNKISDNIKMSGRFNLRELERDDILNTFIENDKVVIIHNALGVVKEKRINLDGRLHLDLMREGVLDTEGTRWRRIDGRIYDRGAYTTNLDFEVEQNMEEDENVAKTKIRGTMRYREMDRFGPFQHFRVNVRAKNLRDLYYAIKIANEEKADGNGYVNLHFEYADSQTEDGYAYRNKRYRSTTINENYLDSYEEFVERILEIRQGEVEGSDMMNDNQLTLLLNKFDIKLIDDLAEGINEVLFECVGMGDEKEKNCGIETIKYVCENTGMYLNKNKEKKHFNSYEKVVNFLTEQLYINNVKIPVNVFGNTFLRNSKKFKEEIKKNQFTKYKGQKMYKMDKSILKPYFICNLQGKKGTDIDFNNSINLIYDHKNKHFDVVKNPFKIKDEIYISRRREIYRKKQNKKGEDVFVLIFKPKHLKQNSMMKEKTQHKYIVFDYETIVDWKESAVLKPYSLSFGVFTEGDLNLLHYCDKENDKDGIEKIRINNCHNAVGWNCTEDLINYIDNNGKDTIYTLISFNGCNFDNFILADWLYKNRMEQITNPCYTDSQLLNFTINGRHNLFDLRRHVIGSLKYNCKSFKIGCCAKKELDHNKVQLDYENNPEKFIEDMKKNDKMIEYNDFDVLATALLYKRYSDTFKQSRHTNQIQLHKKLTIGSIIWEVFQKNNYNTKLPKLDYETYRAILDHKVAGRVELFNGTQIIEEALSSYDVCSLYPFICSVYKCYFPCGNVVKSSWENYQKVKKTKGEYDKIKIRVVETNDFKEHDVIKWIKCKKSRKSLFKDKKGKITNIERGETKHAKTEYTITFDSYDKKNENLIGFFWVNVNQSNLLKKNLPLIYPKKTKIKNDWKEPKLEKVFISSVIIDALLENGCEVEFLEDGIYFDDVKKNYEIFGFLLDFMKGKNEQDLLKGTEKYNSALRETLKLLMNSVSGKVIEGLHYDKIKLVNFYDYNQIKHSEKTEKINTIDIKGNKIFMSYSLKEEELIKKQRPVYLGALIYDYAKMYMWNHIYSKVGLDKLVYTDTDAGKCRKKDGEVWIEEYAGKKEMMDLVWNNVLEFDERYGNHKLYEKDSKVFGSFENELSDNNNLSYITMKKCYLVKNPDGTLDAFHFKGVSKTDILLTGNEDFLYDKITKHKDGTTTIKKIIKSQLEARDFYNKYSETNKLVNCVGKIMYDIKGEELFKNLHQKGYAYILTFNFRKSFKNSLQNVSVDDNHKFNKYNSNLKMVFQIKKLKL